MASNDTSVSLRWWEVLATTWSCGSGRVFKCLTRLTVEDGTTAESEMVTAV